jgi:hypothetical protein
MGTKNSIPCVSSDGTQDKLKKNSKLSKKGIVNHAKTTIPEVEFVVDGQGIGDIMNETYD